MEEDDNEETYLSANHIFFNNTNNIKNNTIYICILMFIAALFRLGRSPSSLATRETPN